MQLFFLMALFERVISTFYYQQVKRAKRVYYEWLFNILFYGYIAIVALSIVEFFVVRKNINIMVSLTGFLYFVTGILLRRKAISALGGNWSLKTEIKEKHSLVAGGIYKYLKHPYYLAVFFELVGICLIANSFYSLVPVFLIQGPLLLVRINLEEMMLIDHFGDAYKKYRMGKLF